MGKEIVYCGGCGKILPESEFQRGRARILGNTAFCTACKPQANPATPRSLAKPPAPVAPTAPAAAAPEAFTRRRMKWAILGAAGVAALALVALLVVLAAGGRKEEVAPPQEVLAPAPQPAPIGKDPRLAEETARDEKLNTLLRTVEQIREKDPTFSRRAAVLALLETALEEAGPRRTSVLRLKADYEHRAEEFARLSAPAEAPPAAPVPAPAPAAPTPAAAAAPNLPPTVAITRPLDGATFTTPAEIAIAAEAADPDGKVAKVEFFLGNVKLGEVASAPYEFTTTVPLPGTCVLTAKATDDAGAETMSAPVTLRLTPVTKRSPFKGAAAVAPGTIQAEDFDEGGEGLGYHVLAPCTKESPYRTAGVPLQPVAGGYCVSGLKAGEWLEYTLDVPATGSYTVEVQVAAKGAGGKFHLEFRRADKTGPLEIPDTGGEQAWKTVTKTGLILDLGEQVLRLAMDSSTGSFDSIRIVDAPAPVAKKPDPAKPDPKKGARPDPFQLKIDEAIRKGTDYLKTVPNVHPQYKELWLLTLLHAGVPDNDPKIQAQLRECLAFRDDGYSARTYNISLLAMVLEEMDRVTYQKDIAKCAQFLLDNECRNGQWSYGAATTYPKDVPTTPAKNVATPTKNKPSAGPRDPNALAGFRVKPPVRFSLKVKPQRDGGDHGDDSNTQYAALGLRACHDAGILLPKESVERARKWWIDFQEPLDSKKKDKGDVATGPPIGTPRGWGYQSDGRLPGVEAYGSTGSMTTGAVGALCIYDYILGLDWKREPAVLDGMAWVAQHFTVKGNMGKELPPAPHPGWHYYYLYALERAGMLYGTQFIGRNDWYLEGSKYLVGAQLPDGSWSQSGYHGTTRVPFLDTCYAILFLKRVTRPLQDVATEDPSSRK